MANKEYSDHIKAIRAKVHAYLEDNNEIKIDTKSVSDYLEIFENEPVWKRNCFFQIVGGKWKNLILYVNDRKTLVKENKELVRKLDRKVVALIHFNIASEYYDDLETKCTFFYFFKFIQKVIFLKKIVSLIL